VDQNSLLIDILVSIYQILIQINRFKEA